MSEYFKLVDLCQTMILGSVEDERVFSSLSFIKNNLRNRLEKNLDTCLRLYTTKHDLSTFPFEEAYALWDSNCHRRTINKNALQDERAFEHVQSFQIYDKFSSRFHLLVSSLMGTLSSLVFILFKV